MTISMVDPPMHRATGVATLVAASGPTPETHRLGSHVWQDRSCTLRAHRAKSRNPGSSPTIVMCPPSPRVRCPAAVQGIVSPILPHASLKSVPVPRSGLGTLPLFSSISQIPCLRSISSLKLSYSLFSRIVLIISHSSSVSASRVLSVIVSLNALEEACEPHLLPAIAAIAPSLRHFSAVG